ncbi:MAG: hypothetical protein HQ530_04410 [Parcubacteria group bacterium]|nr:hypothetical protein [Parcubacteria group bacterium]
MNHEIPRRWRAKVKKYTKKNFGVTRDHLTAMDFGLNTGVEINFPDGSSMSFRHAFYILDKKNNEIAIFTEHCGYYYFKTWDLKYKLLRAKNKK